MAFQFGQRTIDIAKQMGWPLDAVDGAKRKLSMPSLLCERAFAKEALRRELLGLNPVLHCIKRCPAPTESGLGLMSIRAIAEKHGYSQKSLAWWASVRRSKLRHVKEGGMYFYDDGQLAPLYAAHKKWSRTLYSQAGHAHDSGTGQALPSLVPSSLTHP